MRSDISAMSVRCTRQGQTGLLKFLPAMFPLCGIENAHAAVGFQLHPGCHLRPELDLFGRTQHRLGQWPAVRDLVLRGGENRLAITGEGHADNRPSVRERWADGFATRYVPEPGRLIAAAG